MPNRCNAIGIKMPPAAAAISVKTIAIPITSDSIGRPNHHPAMIAISSAVCLVVVGNIAFVGLVVPNLVSAVMGDNLRRSLGWVALSGAGFVLVCDLFARTINYPYEIPVATIAGIIGATVFLAMLLRRLPGRKAAA